MLHRPHAQDRNDTRRVAHDPRDGELRDRAAARLRQGLHLLHRIEPPLRLRGVRVHPPAPRAVRRDGLAATEPPRQPGAGRGRIGGQSDPVFLAERDDLPLDAPLQDVVGRLLAHERVPPVLSRNPERLADLPRRERRAGEVADLPLADQVIQRGEALLDGRGRVRAVQIVQVDVVRAQPAQADLHRAHQVVPAAPLVVRPVPDGPPPLGGHDDLLARQPLQRPADDLLAPPVAVGDGGVPEVDARVERPAQDADGLVVRRVSAPVVPPQTDLADLQPAATQTAKLHVFLLQDRYRGTPYGLSCSHFLIAGACESWGFRSRTFLKHSLTRSG